MTTWILKQLHAKQVVIIEHDIPLLRIAWKMLLLVTGFLLLAQINNELFDLIVSTMSDAYLAVSVFVAMTLALFYFLDGYFKSDLLQILNQRSVLQVPMAAFLGALPGCGGAIIVVTQFVHGKMSFGALVAVLIATMGDAAFLLIAKKPDVALMLYSLSMSAGIVCGYIVNHIHGYDYMKLPSSKVGQNNSTDVTRLPKILVNIFCILLVPGSILGILDAIQFDVDSVFGFWSEREPTKYLGFLGAVLCMMAWFSQPLNSWSARFAEKAEMKYIKDTVVAETSFVSVWVIIGFLIYELLVYFSGIDLSAQFVSLGALAPLLAIIIGFIPGCGPQILVTTLYLNGVVPLSSLLANAISNDGDALFPAIALAPKAAVRATFYSAIPALIVGYSAFMLGW
ncbi:MAG: hypothetical protein ACJATV_001546 [Granulosicoccus sp.]|jgi:hypothetical protein